jgi:hypothetical protein
MSHVLEKNKNTPLHFVRGEGIISAKQTRAAQGHINTLPFKMRTAMRIREAIYNAISLS